jgi:stage V sporulation protein AE
MTKRRIIVVTDGDRVAQKVVEKVAQNIGGRAISFSGGNPTRISGDKIAALVKEAPHDPVLVMVDDCGSSEQGNGEKALKALASDPELEILGVLAVASNTAAVDGVQVSASVTRDGQIVEEPVDKDGNPESGTNKEIKGDTVDIINELPIPVVIGIGDLGKMDDADRVSDGAKITTLAVQEILRRSENRH